MDNLGMLSLVKINLKTELNATEIESVRDANLGRERERETESGKCRGVGEDEDKLEKEKKR